MRPRLASLAPTLLGTAAAVVGLVPATAQAKPSCHGKKAKLKKSARKRKGR